MRKLNRILVLLFVFALALSMTVFAADEGTFNASVTIDTSVADKITVTVPAANDTVLKEQKPTLRIACDFDKAYVMFGEAVLDSDKYELDTENATIEFEVAAAGEYVVVKGDAPVVPTPTPTPIPTPSVTPTPTPTPSVTPSPTPTPAPGAFENVTSSDNFGKADLDESAADLKAAIPLTEEEQAAVNSGAAVDVWIEVYNNSNGVSESEKKLAVNKSGSYTVGMYLDIDMYKRIEGGTHKQLSKLNKDVTVSLVLPDSLLNKDPNLYRNYRVIRVHEGTAKVLTPTFNEKNNVLSFDTDRFSTYAIAYKDTDVPKTGDDSNVALWGAVLAVSAVACAATVVVLRKKTKEN